MHTTSHLTRTIATALVAGAAFVPAAAAQQQDLRMPDTRDAAAFAERKQDLRMPDTRDAAALAERKQDLRMPDTRDAAEGRTAPVVEFVEVPRADGFDVGDAVLGAGSGIGLVLIATGCALTTAHVRRRRLHSAQA